MNAEAANLSEETKERLPINRREFLNYAWLVSIGFFTISAAGVTYLFSLPRFKGGEFGGVITVGTVENLPDVNNPPDNYAKTKFWLSNTPQGLVALYKVCTHLGCLYNWNGQEIKYICPCHGSQFIIGWSGTQEDYITSTVSSGRTTSTRPDLYAGQGSPAMPAWSDQYGGPLRQDQIENIATFILNWESTAIEGVEIEALATPTPSPDEESDPVARGQRVYLDKGCGGCHTIEGLSAGIIGPNQTKIGTVAETRIPGMSDEEYIRESILNPSAYVVEGYPDNAMPKNYGELIEPDQISDLVAFLLFQQ